MLTRSLMTLVCCLAVAGCSQEASEPASETPPAAAAPAPTLPRQASPQGAIVYIISPEDGEEVQSPVTVVFGIKGAGIAPAGINLPNTGHHHLIVDSELASMATPIPADAQHVHFGGGQTEATVELSAGEHVLQLALGDYLHIPHDPPLLSDPVTVQVVE
jgi:hypothetical protein